MKENQRVLMNHDNAHCMDFDEEQCPKDCYRALLTHEAKKKLVGIPLTYTHFLGSAECTRRKRGKKDE